MHSKCFASVGANVGWDSIEKLLPPPMSIRVSQLVVEHVMCSIVIRDRLFNFGWTTCDVSSVSQVVVETHRCSQGCRRCLLHNLWNTCVLAVCVHFGQEELKAQKICWCFVRLCWKACEQLIAVQVLWTTYETHVCSKVFWRFVFTQSVSSQACLDARKYSIVVLVCPNNSTNLIIHMN